MDDRLSVVRDVVSRSGALVVSTVGPQGPWCAPVGFSLEDGFRLAFLSLPETRHVQDLLADPRISASLFTADGGYGGYVGIQMAGETVFETSPEPGQWCRICIRPDEVWSYDSRRGTTGRERLDLAELAAMTW